MEMADINFFSFVFFRHPRRLAGGLERQATRRQSGDV
jgi:hypothetical protein